MHMVVTKASYKRLIVAYNNVFRIFFGIERGSSISFIYVHNNIDSNAILTRKSLYGLNSRLKASENTLVACLRSSAFVYASNFNVHYCKSLDTL